MSLPALPQVSVVVPVYNGAATIVRCIDSLLALDFPPERRELLVVDNGSTDLTRELLAGFEDAVRIVPEATRGPAAARNAGIRAARGEWIAFTDADCVVDPGWLRHVLPPLAEPAVGIVGGRVRALPPCNRIQRFGERIHDQRRAIEDLDPPYVATANWASRRAVLAEHGCFDETLFRGSDSELAQRIGAGRYRLVYRAEAVVFHPHEATLRGLFQEGCDHGRGSVAARATGRNSSVPPPRIRSTLRRLGKSGARLLSGPERFEALCQAVFDLGKTTGKLVERVRLRLRRHQA